MIYALEYINTFNNSTFDFRSQATFTAALEYYNIEGWYRFTLFYHPTIFCWVNLALMNF